MRRFWTAGDVIQIKMSFVEFGDDDNSECDMFRDKTMRGVTYTAHFSLLICMHIVIPIVDSQHGQISDAYKGSVTRDHPKWWLWQVLWGGEVVDCPWPTEMYTCSVLCIVVENECVMAVVTQLYLRKFVKSTTCFGLWVGLYQVETRNNRESHTR
jgi:hypothetical protein